MPTSVSSAPISKNGPSPAIQKGADMLLAIFESERKELQAAHQKEIEESEARFANLKARFMAKKDPESLCTAQKAGSFEEEFVMDYRLSNEKNQELESLRNSHERLKLSLEEMGFVYVDGVIRFRDEAAQIVAQIVEDAKIKADPGQKEAQDESKDSLQKPNNFVHFVAELLERNRCVVQGLESQLQALQEVQRENILEKVASFGEQIDSLKERIEAPKLCPNCNASVGLGKLAKSSGEGINRMTSKKHESETLGASSKDVRFPARAGPASPLSSKPASPGLVKTPTSPYGFPFGHPPARTPGYEEISTRPLKRAASPPSIQGIPAKIQKPNEPNS